MLILIPYNKEQYINIVQFDRFNPFILSYSTARNY